MRRPFLINSSENHRTSKHLIRAIRVSQLFMSLLMASLQIYFFFALARRNEINCGIEWEMKKHKIYAHDTRKIYRDFARIFGIY